MNHYTTTLLLIPGGEELLLPENADALRSAMRTAVAERTAEIIMLADNPLIPEKQLHARSKFKNVLLIESDRINDEEDAWNIALEMQGENYLPVIASVGFDFQVVRMELVEVKYEDFEIVDKYVRS